MPFTGRRRIRVGGPPPGPSPYDPPLPFQQGEDPNCFSVSPLSYGLRTQTFEQGRGFTEDYMFGAWSLSEAQSAALKWNAHSGYQTIIIARHDGSKLFKSFLSSEKDEINKTWFQLISSITRLHQDSLTERGFSQALMNASYYGYTTLFDRLSPKLSANPNVSFRGFSPLYCATQQGHADIVEKLLQAGASVDNVRLPCLLRASDDGNMQIAQLLLRYGADPNWVTANATTALLNACEKGHLEVVKLLLRADANPNYCSGTTQNTALIIACNKGFESIVSSLLQFGADPNLRGTRITALEVACRRGDVSIVTKLLAYRAYVTATAVALAVSNGNGQIVELLVANDASISLLASMLGYTDIFRKKELSFEV